MKLTDYIATSKVGENNVVVVMGGTRNKRVVVNTKLGPVELSLIIPTYDRCFRVKNAFDKSSLKDVDTIFKDVEEMFGKDFVDVKWDKAIATVDSKTDTLHNRRIIMRTGLSTFYSIRYTKE